MDECSNIINLKAEIAEEGIRKRVLISEEESAQSSDNIITKESENCNDEPYLTVTTKVKRRWSVCKFEHLPEWMQDNEFLIFGYRPELRCFKTCLKSIFRLHTETGNIWTHLIGFLVFVSLTIKFLVIPMMEIEIQDKFVFLAFLLAAMTCLGLSSTYHTFYCHSENMSKFFSKMDYCGISLLIMGSFVPWIYYGFYCHFLPKVIHLTTVSILGTVAICVSLIDKFATPAYRPLRAATFIIFGLSAVIPAIHYGILEGLFNHISQKALGWLILVGILYIAGALTYVARVPERWYPGKFDIWLHSHQIFHVFVVGAALLHFYGIYELALHRVTDLTQCKLL